MSVFSIARIYLLRDRFEESRVGECAALYAQRIPVVNEIILSLTVKGLSYFAPEVPVLERRSS